MSSCCEKPSESTKSSCCGDKDNTNEQSALGLLKTILDLSPVFPALLHSSCCWLPVIIYSFSFSGYFQRLFADVEYYVHSQSTLQFLSISSAFASNIERVRPVFLTVTLIILGWDLYTRGFTKSSFARLAITTLLLAWPHLSASTVAETSTHHPQHKSCH